MKKSAEDEAANALYVENSEDEDLGQPESGDYLEALKRLKAEYDNYRRRTESERHLKDEEAVGRFVEKLLPVFEAFEAGMEYNIDSLKPVYDLLMSAMTENGLIVISPEDGSDFDPHFHEAVDGDGRTIQEVVRFGYAWRQGDQNGERDQRLLRPAQVRVREQGTKSES